MKYLHYFETEEGFIEERNNNYIEPWTSYTEERGVDYNKPDYTEVPFTIEALGSGEITWALGEKTVQYSKNGGSWITMDSGTSISVVNGDIINFNGTNSSYQQNTISSTANFNAFGNIMSLTDGDNFKTASSVTQYAFQYMFSGCTSLISVENLKLPAMNLANFCYQGLFDGCSNLEKAMPILPATSLTTSCYAIMFRNCSKLERSPILPCRTLVQSCYASMFRYCSSLNWIKALFYTEPGTPYTASWVQGVSATGTFVKYANAKWSVKGVNGIPSGWTVQTATE